MADVLVVSVFARHPNNRFWLQRHRETLGRSHSDYDYAVFLNDEDPALFRDCPIIGHNPAPRKSNRGHFDALQELTAYCRRNPHRYYLVLDSDAFVVCDDWLKVLVDALRRHRKAFAAPARVENLDFFPHPSAVFTADPECLVFGMLPDSTLLGRQTVELQCSAPRERWLPLLKSNRVSLHPTLATIYHNVIYHHGAGSRLPIMRSTHDEHYYDHYLGRCLDAASLLAELKRNPDEFVACLRHPV